MNQRKPNNLSLQPFIHSMTKLKAGHPPTPYPTTQERVLKKRKTIEDEEIINTQPYLMSFPSLNSTYFPTSLRYNITPAELMRASESIFNQVNWSEVVLDTVGKEKSVIYRNAFEKILRTQITELLRQEECIEKSISKVVRTWKMRTSLIQRMEMTAIIKRCLDV